MPVRSVSERARKKLMNHARQIYRYSSLGEKERSTMLELMRQQFRVEGMTQPEADGIVATLDLHYRVDVVGGVRKHKPIEFHEPLV